MGQKDQPAGDGGPGQKDRAAPAAPPWQTCGRHRFYLHADVLFWECHGPMEVSEVAALFAARVALQRQYGHGLVIVDARDTDSVPPESRRYAAQLKPDPPLRGVVVVFGAGLLTRAAVSLIAGAARLFGRGEIRTLFFTQDETQAWATLERERLALREV